MAEAVIVGAVYFTYKTFKYVSGRYKDGKMRASAHEIELGHQNQVYQVLSGLVAGVYAADRDDEADASAWWWKLGYEEMSLKGMHCAETELAQVGESHCRVRLTLFRRKRERSLSQPVAVVHGQSQQTTTPLPKYVVAIRGSIPKSPKTNDVLKLGLSRRVSSRRNCFESAEILIQQIVKRFSAEDVWVTGHSLGAAIALVASRKLALQGMALQTHLFNAPNFSVHKIAQGAEKKGVAKDLNRLRSGDRGSVWLRETGPAAEKVIERAKRRAMEFEELRRARWTPHVYVNPKDAYCSKYFELFKPKHHATSIPPEHPKSKRQATSSSASIEFFTAPVVAAVAGSRIGNGSNHLLPAAILYFNHWGQGPLEPRKFHQWYQYDGINLRVLNCVSQVIPVAIPEREKGRQSIDVPFHPMLSYS